MLQVYYKIHHVYRIYIYVYTHGQREERLTVGTELIIKSRGTRLELYKLGNLNAKMEWTKATRSNR